MTGTYHRRAYLALLAAGFGSGSGCTTAVGPGTQTDSPTDSETTGSSSPADDPTDAHSVVLERVDVPESGTLTVLPPALASWLRDAAEGESVREVVSVSHYTPQPSLLAFDAIELRAAGEPLGTFAVDADGGTYYKLLVGANEVESVPENETATPVSELPSERRELARHAIGDERRTVQPQTQLGEWVRNEWFQGYFRHDGVTYRGIEVQQTDAAFFSKRFWVVLRLSETTASGGDPVYVELPQTNTETRVKLHEAVTEARGEDGSGSPIEIPATELSDAGRTFVRETEYLLTHTSVFSVSVS
ncbi:hypothetical protein ACH9L7_02295 [Haloferax sp. S1W]|uniref:hypothetical protein n=1 Tax=Haloferax sp. S1W TaxID=3377110 RepID=UPI0037C7A8D0